MRSHWPEMNITPAKILRQLFCLILILSWVIMPRVSFSDDLHDHKIRALYLYNFLLFVDWPKTVHSDSHTMKVLIYGDPQLYEALKPMSGKMIRGRQLMIEASKRGADPGPSCHVLFVGHKEEAAAKGLLEKVSGRPVLTISDMEGFVRQGGMVVFRKHSGAQKKGKPEKRFLINLPVVLDVNLKIRSRLLRISHVVTDEKSMEGP